MVVEDVVVLRADVVDEVVVDVIVDLVTEDVVVVPAKVDIDAVV